MQAKFGTTQIAAQPIVGIRTTVAMSEIGRVLGSLFGEVHGHIRQNGQQPAGPPLAIYYSPPGDTVDLECAIPVASPLVGGGRVTAGALPACRAATVTHVGSYETLPETWAALTAWMKSQDLAAAGAPWESYVTDPGAEPDQSKWRTEIFFPVR